MGLHLGRVFHGLVLYHQSFQLSIDELSGDWFCSHVFQEYKVIEVLRVKPLERIIDFMGLNFLDSVIVVVRGARINARISAVIQ